MSEQPFPVLSPGLQVQFWSRLQVVRAQYLSDGLSAAVQAAGVPTIDAELSEFIGGERLTALAAYQLRGEVLYAVPCVLRAKPMLLGYYRLLCGFSQKEFYSKGPFGRFRAMEEVGRLSRHADAALAALCRSLDESAWTLFRGIEPITAGGLHDLQLLTVGPQFRGAQNNQIGQKATAVVFELIRMLVAHQLIASTEQSMTVRNASGRTVSLAFAADPDIAIMETLPSQRVPTVSIEIKGGGDVSNVHNRIGEAEKSHQKARGAGFTQFWTILNAHVSPAVAKRESPTTTEFFYLDDILDTMSEGHKTFRDRLYQTIGIA